MKFLDYQPKEEVLNVVIESETLYMVGCCSESIKREKKLKNWVVGFELSVTNLLFIICSSILIRFLKNGITLLLPLMLYLRNKTNAPIHRYGETMNNNTEWYLKSLIVRGQRKIIWESMTYIYLQVFFF